MLKIRDAKALFAASVVVAPWDIVLFDGSLGWGVTFPFARFVSVRGETTFLGPVQLLSLYLDLGASGTDGALVTLAWILSVALGVGGALYAVGGRVRRGGTTPVEDRRVGALFVAAGLLFLLSRLLGGSVLTWTSVPIGAAYVVFVGVVFYRNLFRLGV